MCSPHLGQKRERERPKDPCFLFLFGTNMHTVQVVPQKCPVFGTGHPVHDLYSALKQIPLFIAGGERSPFSKVIRENNKSIKSL